jgi:CRISPR-associated protein Csy3
MSKKQTLPAVLSFQRCMVISDGLMYSIRRFEFGKPINVVRHGIRGTINISAKAERERLIAQQEKGQKKSNNVTNIQITETAKTDPDSEGVAIRFVLRPIDLNYSLFACAGESGASVRDGIELFIKKAKSSEGLQEVCRRYARNILNGRWLWRNRILGSSIKITIVIENGDTKTIFVDNALLIPLNTFGDYNEQEIVLGRTLAECFIGNKNAVFTVEAMVSWGPQAAVEVFPSQNYTKGKPEGFARPLYKIGKPERYSSGDPDSFTDTRVMGLAAIRDQKIGNAIRTIDTWYENHAEVDRPIPIEPNGASLDLMAFLRKTTSTASSLLKNIAQINPDSDDGMFMIAVLIRGGVFGESEKGNGNKNLPETSEVAVSGDEN